MLYLVAWLSLLCFPCARGDYVGIINGTKVGKDVRHYMVSVQHGGGHACGGFLVNAYFVITAAHCIRKGAAVEGVTVVVAAHDLRNLKPESRKAVKLYFIHEEYNPRTFDNDIALLKLAEEQKRSNSVNWIALPAKDADITALTVCSVAGWGAIETNGHANVELLQTNVVIMPRKKCKEKWTSLTKQQVCANGQGGFCQGDSGGPLVCNGKAEGVVSFYQPRNCDKPTKPNVYTRVSAYLPWIKQKIQEAGKYEKQT